VTRELHLPPVRGTILVVDDEANIADLVDMYLRKEGFRVLKAGSGEDALVAAKRERPRLVVLDVGLPGIDGLEVCRQVRATSQVPIIMLTARDDEIEKVLGLELGADDYVTKPFFIAELRSRIRAVLRRADRSAWSASDDVLSVDGIVLDSARRTVQAHGTDVALTYVEFEILRTMMASPGRVFSRQSLLEAVWESADYRDPRTIDVHVRHLREKLEPNPREPVYIHTVRGVGYRFRG
jgi:DNA-binding response OmpR family regulator